VSWLATLWRFGSSVPGLLSGGYGIWIRIGLVVAAITAAAGWGFIRGIEHGADQRAEIQVQLGRCQDGQAELKASLVRQNGALEAMRVDAARRAQEAAGAVQAAQAARAAAQGEAQRLRRLRGSQASKQGPCPAAAAIEEIRRGLR